MVRLLGHLHHVHHQPRALEQQVLGRTGKHAVRPEVDPRDLDGDLLIHQEVTGEVELLLLIGGESHRHVTLRKRRLGAGAQAAFDGLVRLLVQDVQRFSELGRRHECEGPGLELRGLGEGPRRGGEHANAAFFDGEGKQRARPRRSIAREHPQHHAGPRTGLGQIGADTHFPQPKDELVEHYRRIASLREYVLISQKSPTIERYLRNADDTWTLTAVIGVDASIHLSAIDATLSLAEVYDRVTFDEPDSLRPVAIQPNA